MLEYHHNLRGDHLAECGQPLQLLLRVTHEGLNLDRHLRQCPLLSLLKSGNIGRLLLLKPLVLSPGQPLDEDLNTPVRQFKHPYYHPYRSKSVEIVRLRLILGDILLGSEEYETVLSQRHVNRVNRLLSPHKEGHYHKGEYDDIPYRQKRQGLRYINLLSIFN